MTNTGHIGKHARGNEVKCVAERDYAHANTNHMKLGVALGCSFLIYLLQIRKFFIVINIAYQKHGN